MKRDRNVNSGVSSGGPKKVLAVIPNYNGGDLVLRCIESVLKQTYANVETVIVDNASTDGSLDKIRKKFPDLKIIETGYNAGWGIACNIGMKSAPSDFVALINNDALLEPKCVEEMVKALELNPRYGSCATRILLLKQKNRIEACGLSIYWDGSSCGRGRLRSAKTFMKTEEVFCANDCCCLYRREMIEDIGDYDPDFFIYCDETDMGWKHQLAGWKCVYAPNAVVYHAHSRTAGSYSSFKAYHVERNRIYLCMKYFPLPLLLASPFFTFWRYSFQVYLWLFHKKGALSHYKQQNSFREGVWTLVRAYWDALMKLPVMWKRRHWMKKKMRISRDEFYDLFRRYGLTTKGIAIYE